MAKKEPQPTPLSPEGQSIYETHRALAALTAGRVEGFLQSENWGDHPVTEQMMAYIAQRDEELMGEIFDRKASTGKITLARAEKLALDDFKDRFLSRQLWPLVQTSLTRLAQFEHDNELFFNKPAPIGRAVFEGDVRAKLLDAPHGPSKAPAMRGYLDFWKRNVKPLLEMGEAEAAPEEEEKPAKGSKKGAKKGPRGKGRSASVVPVGPGK
jgi:hypothetical protein